MKSRYDTGYARIIILLFFCFADIHVVAQQSKPQLWGDYDLNFPFANSYVFETEFSYQTLLSEKDKWRSINLTPTLERNIFSFADVIFETPLSYTFQTDTLNTMEIRGTLGTRFYFTTGKRIEVRAVLKWENRFMRDENDKSWETSDRFRVFGQIKTAINRKTHYEDNLWYTTLETEGFFVVDEDVSERYANRFKVSLVLGYRLNYNFRFESYYVFQKFKNALEDEFSSDRIIRFRFIHFINKAKPK